MRKDKEYQVKSIIIMVLKEDIVEYETIADELGISLKLVSTRIMKDMREMYPTYFKKVIEKLNKDTKTHHVDIKNV